MKKIRVGNLTVVARWKGDRDGVCNVPDHIAEAYLRSGLAVEVGKSTTSKRTTKKGAETATKKSKAEER